MFVQVLMSPTSDRHVSKETPRETLTPLLKRTGAVLIAAEFVTTKTVNNLYIHQKENA